MAPKIVVLLTLGIVTTGILVAQTPSTHPVSPSQMRTLGLIGGTSWRSTLEYYRYINQSVNDLYGANTNPPLIIYNLNQHEINELQRQGRWNDIASTFSTAVRKLEMAGAEAVLFCANTSYKVYPEVSRKANVPILHIGDATGLAIQHARLKKVGLIGTSYTMEDPFLRRWLEEKYHVEVIVPQSTAVREQLQRIIHQELTMGVFKPETKQYVLKQIADLQERGAQGIILGCTEFSLTISQSDLTIPVFDTTRLHSQMAVDFVTHLRTADAGHSKRVGSPGD